MTNRKTLLDPGFLGPHLDSFLLDLERRGYTRLTMSNYAASVAHFSEWARARGLALDSVTDDALTLFEKHKCSCPGSRRVNWVSRKYVSRVRCFVGFLRAQLILPPGKTPPHRDTAPQSALIGEFIRWLFDNRGISEKTAQNYTYMLDKFPACLFPPEDSHQLDAATVRALILEHVLSENSWATRHMTTAIRMYLRFLGSTGKCAAGLEGAVPLVAQWRLSTLPRYLPPDEVERLVGTCDTATLMGIRDRAVLLLLIRLGLRAGDIRNLRLNDVDWRSARLKVCGKSRRETWMPLPQDAGDALLDYLKQRPVVPLDHVFLCVQAPYRALPTAGLVSSIVARALKRAGIKNPPSKGTSLLRHSAATSMLRGGASLGAVSEVLRHSSLDMTMHYAKVDIPTLQRISQPWPGTVL